MELPHWLMVVGALLLVFGFFGLALRRNVQVTSDPDGWEGDPTGEAHTLTSSSSATAAS
jgi:hypothetical protein